MRKFLLFLFLICTEFVFAQEKREVSFSHYCFKQLEVTVKNYGYLKDNGAYGWGVKIKNNYKVPVSFTYSLIVGDEKPGNGQPTYVIEPGETWASDWGRLSLLLKKSNSTEFQVRIWKLCFKGYDCSDENYFDCDGQQAKDKLFGRDWRTKYNQNNSQTNNSSNNNNYNTATDLVNRLNELCPQLGQLTNDTNNSIYTGICNGTTYTANDVNLLKSHIMQLENEITRLQNSNSYKQVQQAQIQQQQQNQQVQQAEQQRIAQENARRAEEEKQQKKQQQQQYNTSVNQAQNNMQKGNYSDAMQGYADAVSSAGSKSEKQLATGGAIISGLTGLADIWQKSSKERQERKLLEAEAQRKKAEEDAKKEEDERKKKEAEQKKKEEECKGLFDGYKPQPLDYIIINDAVSIQSVINNHIIAIGGLEKLKAVKNITKSTETKISPTETYFKNKSITAYGKFVWNMTDSNGINSSKTVFNGVTGYRESYNKKTTLDSESITMYKKTQPIDILKLQENADLELGKQIILFGSEGCYAIIERSKNKAYNYVKKYYFSRDTGLWLGVENLTTGPNNYSSTSYIFYENYREVDGILFSFTQRSHSQYPGFNSEHRYTLSGTETTEIKINEPLKDKIFE